MTPALLIGPSPHDSEASARAPYAARRLRTKFRIACIDTMVSQFVMVTLAFRVVFSLSAGHAGCPAALPRERCSPLVQLGPSAMSAHAPLWGVSGHEAATCAFRFMGTRPGRPAVHRHRADDP